MLFRSDHGTTWTQNTTLGTKPYWNKPYASDNGQYVILAPGSVIGPYSDYLYLSSDYGVTFTSILAAGVHNWTGAVISNGGMEIAAIYDNTTIVFHS